MITAAQRFTSPRLIHRAASGVTAGVLLLFCLTCLAGLAAYEASRLFLVTDAGFGDTYILHDIQRYQRTGQMYPDLSEPPYMPAQYSPLLYSLYSLAGNTHGAANPFLRPRLIAAAIWLLCMAVVISLVRALAPARRAWIWGALATATITSMQPWVLLLRGDFAGICLSLTAVRLLLARSRWAVLLAGVSAGLAVHFKIMFVAALAAGGLWLLARRRWKDLAVFAVAGALASAGLYAVFILREPQMLRQIFALSPGIWDIRGGAAMILHSLREPIVLLSLAALPPVRSFRWPRWGLLWLYVAISFGLAAFTVLQAGASTNYFYEPLLALVPAATLGIVRLIGWARRSVYGGVFVAGLIAIYFLPAAAAGVLSNFRELQRVGAKNSEFRAVEQLVRGRRVLTTWPRLALEDPNPPMIEPFLFSYMERLGKLDPRPVAGRIEAGEFDLLITNPDGVFRGIPHVSPTLQTSIDTAYRTVCLWQDYRALIPRTRPEDPALLESLRLSGCKPAAVPIQ